MRQPRLRRLFAGAGLAALAGALALSGCGPTRGAVRAAEDALLAETAIDAAIAAPTRTPANVLRDRYRHPAETLAFFGVDPTDTLVEIWPGGGWYTEILAPLLADRGVYH